MEEKNVSSKSLENEIINIYNILKTNYSDIISTETIEFIKESSLKQLHLINLTDEEIEEIADKKYKQTHLISGWVKTFMESKIQGFIEGIEWTQCNLKI